MIDTEKYPHVHDWQWPLIEMYGDLLNNTGGNLSEDLLNDLQRPSTNERPNRLASTNIVRFTLAAEVQSQLVLLHCLREKRFLLPRVRKAAAT